MTGSLLYRESIANQGRVASTGEKVETAADDWSEYLKMKWEEVKAIDWLGLAYRVLLGPMGPLLLLVGGLAAAGAWCAARAHPMSRGYRLLVSAMITAAIAEGVEGWQWAGEETGWSSTAAAMGVIAAVGLIAALWWWCRCRGLKLDGQELEMVLVPSLEYDRNRLTRLSRFEGDFRQWQPFLQSYHTAVRHGQRLRVVFDGTCTPPCSSTRSQQSPGTALPAQSRRQWSSHSLV
jgi:hypothetical protein